MSIHGFAKLHEFKSMHLSNTQRRRLLWRKSKLSQLFVVKPIQLFCIRAELMQIDSDPFSFDSRSMILALHGCSHPSWAHKPIGQEQETRPLPQQLHESDSCAMDKLGIFKRRASIRVNDIDLFGVQISCFDIDDESKPPKESIFKISIDKSALRHTSMEVWDNRTWNTQSDWEA